MIFAIGELNTRVNVYEFAPSDGPEQGEEEKRVLFSCWAKVERVRMSDREVAKANGNLDDITVIIRDPYPDFLPDTKQLISINARGYQNKRYNIKSVQPDMQDKRFVVIIAEVAS